MTLTTTGGTARYELPTLVWNGPVVATVSDPSPGVLTLTRNGTACSGSCYVMVMNVDS